jgi:chromate reductase, NAD(P)H dehydrogenase (quinone)
VILRKLCEVQDKTIGPFIMSGSEFVGKPIALFNTSSRAVHAQASLIEIITRMSGIVVPEAFIVVSLLGRQLDAAGIAVDREMGL